MRQKNREVKDQKIICAMLDQIEFMNVAIADEPFPYIVPLNFGYEFNEELVVYFHCANEGTKLQLLQKNGHVSFCAASFISYANGTYKGHLHDYRSVIGKGIAERVVDEEEIRWGHDLLLSHNHRKAMKGDEEAMKYIQLWKITCQKENVSAKAEITPNCIQEVGYAPAAIGSIEVDEHHILEKENQDC